MTRCTAAATRTALLAALPLAFASCTTLGGVVDREAKSVTYQCEGGSVVTMETHAVVVSCPKGPAPTIRVQTSGTVSK